MLFIFDWDGTLSDSTLKITRSMQLAARSVGLPVRSDDLILNIIGLGLPEAISLLYAEVGPGERAALGLAYSKAYVYDDLTPITLFPGVEETLNELRDKGYGLTVATGKSRKGLDRALQNLGLEGFFHASRCADETASKPHPLMLHQLLDVMRSSATEAVMVGDTEYDMEMARLAGMPRVAVSYGAHSMARLLTYEPVLCLDSFSEITSLLGENNT